jgi:hypothetical protein
MKTQTPICPTILSPKERLEHEFWIDRHGQIIRYCPEKGENIENIFSFHTYAARQHFKEGDAEQMAEKAGWIKVPDPLSHYPVSIVFPAKSQIKRLDKLGWKYFDYDRKYYKVEEYL